MPKVKFYAVKIGRGGPNIYNTWEECSDHVSRWPGAKHKSFTNRKSAEEWLADVSRLSATPLSESTRWHEQNEGPAPGSNSGNSLNSPIPISDSPEPSQTLINSNAPIPPSATEPPLLPQSLSVEQRRVLDLVISRKSVFFTGSAGTGKSFLLAEILKVCAKPVGITASTGLAAINIGGTTLHSWAGIGLGQEPAKKLADKIRYQMSMRPVYERWIKVKTLVIDEISMLDGALWDKLEFIGRTLRTADGSQALPFGGIQLVLSGDFCQLPPVPNRINGEQIAATFAFDAKTWNDCVRDPITLSRVFRQKDQSFVDMLNAMRLGRMSADTVTKFQQLSRPVVYNDSIEPTELFPTRAEVDRANSTRLQQLPNDPPPQRYDAHDQPGINSQGYPVTIEQMNRLLERLVVGKEIILKVGAQVMLVKNLVQGSLVNGSVGQVIAFRTGREALEEHTQISDDMDAPASDKKPAASQAVRSDRVWPLVKFQNGRKLLCVPTEFTVNNANGDTEARRDQVPLILAYAISIHKSQGQTLQRVKVDLRRVFEKGQAYVALSRAVQLDALQVLNFNPALVIAHPRVLEWQEQIEEEAAIRDAQYIEFDTDSDFE